MNRFGQALVIAVAGMAMAAAPGAEAAGERGPDGTGTGPAQGGDRVGSAPDRVVGRTLPAGFRDRLVRRVQAPMALAWTPDGRMLVAQKFGRLRVIHPNGRMTTALRLGRQACINGSRGLTSVAVDPDFTVNRFIYVYYTHNAHHSCGVGGSRSPEHRVVRYTLRANSRVNHRTAKVIVDHILSADLQHNGGDLEFGRNGYLYISVGDGKCRVRRGDLCGENNNNAQLRRVPHGKVLRVNRAGRAPATNPFVGRPGARRCTRPAGIQRGKGPCVEVFATGLRNPYRIAKRPGTNTFYVNDVGLYHWEEIDLLKRGRNYGWNKREGHCATGSATRCGPSRFKAPLYDYGHGSCLAITGGAFVPRSLQGVWPRRFIGSYLFADYGCGEIFRLVNPPGPGLSRANFRIGAPGVTHLDFGPHKASKALYYLDFTHNTIRRITYRR